MEHIRISDKIRLEKIKLSMAPLIFETIDRDRDYLQEWLPFVHYTNQVSDTEIFIESISANHNSKDDVFSIWYTEKFAGLIGFKDTDRANRKTEIGYWLARDMQGKRIITSSVEILLKYAFQKLKMNRIQIKVAEGNSKSEAIPTKLGFKYEGLERDGEFNKNKYFNLKIYSLLKSEWR